jgi:hypothetical protein
MAGEQVSQPSEIASLDDAFRRAGPTHDWLMTRGATALPDTVGLIRAVMLFDNFTHDNDPYGEHDFCTFLWHGEKVL